MRVGFGVIMSIVVDIARALMGGARDCKRPIVI